MSLGTGLLTFVQTPVLGVGVVGGLLSCPAFQFVAQSYPGQQAWLRLPFHLPPQSLDLALVLLARNISVGAQSSAHAEQWRGLEVGSEGV